jgi:hypothetical protein
MKHIINNGACVNCGLNARHRMTGACANKIIREDNAKLITQGKLDYTVTDGWVNLNVEKTDATAQSKQDNLVVYEKMEKFIKDFMEGSRQQHALEQIAHATKFNVLSVSNPSTEEYALSKDETEFLKQIHDQPIPKWVVGDCSLKKEQYLMLYSLRNACYVTSNEAYDHWVVTPKAETYLKSLSEPAPLVMSEDGIALLLMLSDNPIDNGEILHDEDMADAADLLVDFGLAYACGKHLHITPKGTTHIKNLLEMKLPA